MEQMMVEATHQTEQVRKYYTWRASNYDAGASFEVEHHAEALTLASVHEGQRVLDAIRDKVIPFLDYFSKEIP